jgi:hypothetical protein
MFLLDPFACSAYDASHCKRCPIRKREFPALSSAAASIAFRYHSAAPPVSPLLAFTNRC